jgi:hypothetical protein
MTCLDNFQHSLPIVLDEIRSGIRFGIISIFSCDLFQFLAILVVQIARHKFSIGFKSRLSAGHGRTGTPVLLSQVAVDSNHNFAERSIVV